MKGQMMMGHEVVEGMVGFHMISPSGRVSGEAMVCVSTIDRIEPAGLKNHFCRIYQGESLQVVGSPCDEVSAIIRKITGREVVASIETSTGLAATRQAPKETDDE